MLRTSSCLQCSIEPSVSFVHTQGVGGLLKSVADGAVVFSSLGHHKVVFVSVVQQTIDCHRN